MNSPVGPHRVLSHADVAEAKAEKGRATAEIGDLKQRLADEGQEWAWPLLTSLLGAGGEEQDEKKGKKGAKQKREEEGEEWSLYAVLRRHHTEGKEGRQSHHPYSQPFGPPIFTTFWACL